MQIIDLAGLPAEHRSAEFDRIDAAAPDAWVVFTGRIRQEYLRLANKEGRAQ
jgi:hypothetical protein